MGVYTNLCTLCNVDYVIAVKFGGRSEAFTRVFPLECEVCSGEDNNHFGVAFPNTNHIH